MAGSISLDSKALNQGSVAGSVAGSLAFTTGSKAGSQASITGSKALNQGSVAGSISLGSKALNLAFIAVGLGSVWKLEHGSYLAWSAFSMQERDHRDEYLAVGLALSLMFNAVDLAFITVGLALSLMFNAVDLALNLMCNAVELAFITVGLALSLRSLRSAWAACGSWSMDRTSRAVRSALNCVIIALSTSSALMLLLAR